MKNVCLTWILLLGCLMNPVQAETIKQHSTALFYAPNLPVELLSQYQRVIVEADNVKPEELTALHQGGASVLAYLSIGEIAPSRKWYKSVKPAWILGKNRVWDSEIMDLTNPEWRHFIIEELVAPLAKQGYDGLFLDTLDSFQLIATTDEARNQQAEALTQTLNEIRTQYPQLKLVANRGFEVMPHIAPLLDAVLAESLYAAWDNAHQRFHPSKAADTEWLLQKLQALQKEFKLEIIVLDYLPPEERDAAEKLAKRIEKHGFVPWISVASLDIVGVGMKPTAPKTFLLTYDSVQESLIPPLPYAAVEAALSKHGYKLHRHDIQTGLPIQALTGRYAGILSFLPFETQSKAYQNWLLQQHRAGMLFQALLPPASLPDSASGKRK